MAKKVKYIVNQEMVDSHWDAVRLQMVKAPKFQLITSTGELICEMKSSPMMESAVKNRFQEMADRFNKEPFKIDLEK